MGRIKTKLIKAKTKEFLESNGEDFSKDFAHNKQELAKLANFQSKKMRNTIAGYLVRKKKAQQ